MEEHIFDILGVGTRENSYTDLIDYAFTHNKDFRQKFLELLGEQDYSDWECKVRPNITIKSGRGRKKDVPDLILINYKSKKICLIENKLFSGEGWEQTKRYASSEFRTALKKELQIKPKNIKFFYLTLEGISPVSSNFKTVSYLGILNFLKEISLGNSKLDILLKELQERLEEYYNWNKPKDNEIVIDYLKRTRRLVNWEKTFRIVSENVFNKKEFKKWFGITGNCGSGYIPLCQWYKMSWIGKKYPDEKDGTKCYNIHFEFHWDTRQDWENLTLYLHYETNPYMTRKQMESIESNFIKKYTKARDDFFKYIKESAPNGWKISKTSLRIAYYTFNKSIKFRELQEQMYKLINVMSPHIDEYLKSK